MYPATARAPHFAGNLLEHRSAHPVFSICEGASTIPAHLHTVERAKRVWKGPMYDMPNSWRIRWPPYDEQRGLPGCGRAIAIMAATAGGRWHRRVSGHLERPRRGVRGLGSRGSRSSRNSQRLTAGSVVDGVLAHVLGPATGGQLLEAHSSSRW